MKIEFQDMELDNVEIPDLRRLKELSERLHLSPKRESVMQWHYDLEKLQSEGIYPSLSKVKENATAEECEYKTRTAAEAPSDSIPIDVPVMQVEDGTSYETTNISSVINKPIATSGSSPTESSTSLQCCRVRETFTKVTLRGEKQEFTKPTTTKKYFKPRTFEHCRETIKGYAQRTGFVEPENGMKLNIDDQDATPERFKLIGQALERIRTDLLDMRIQDNALARQLLENRRKLIQVKAEKTCEEHAKLLEDFSWELEIEEELTEQLRSFDLPTAFLRSPDSLLRGSSQLRLMGISRMTMQSQRFSVI